MKLTRTLVVAALCALGVANASAQEPTPAQKQARDVLQMNSLVLAVSKLCGLALDASVAEAANTNMRALAPAGGLTEQQAAAVTDALVAELGKDKKKNCNMNQSEFNVGFDELNGLIGQMAKGLTVPLKPYPRHPDGELIAASTTDIDKTVEIAKAHGEVTLAKDSDGDPQIRIKSKVGSWIIRYYGCTKGEDCKTMQFYYGIATKNKVSAAKINDWNRTKRWAKAYLDKDGDPNITFDVLSRYGVSRAMLNASMALWVDVIDDFKTTMTKD